MEAIKINECSVDMAIDLLNQALASDKKAVQMLIEYRVPCNEVIADHPTIQVGVLNKLEKVSPLTYRVGMLGIINGMFGVDENQCGFIAARFDDETNELIGFERYKGGE